jgi:rhodanese-related sulfurtransferase
MGLGFVIGGYCPGTSVCAAAIGKTDAMLFLGGALLGVLAFAEGYPLFEELYKSGAAGSPQVFATLGLPKALFAFMLTAIALIAFWAVSIIEDRNNGRKAILFHLNRATVTTAAVGLLVAVTGFLMPSKKEALLDESGGAELLDKQPLRLMSADELAFRLIDDDKRIRIFDFRSTSAFERLRLPHSVAFTAGNLFEKDASRLLSVRKQRNVFIADDEKEARRMAAIAGELGFENVFVLRGGMKEFESAILSFKPGRTPGSGHSADTQRFRTHAASVLPGIIASSRSTGPVKKTAKRTVGGC